MMKRLLVLVSLLAAVPVTAQEPPRTDEMTQLKYAVSGLQKQIAGLESKVAAMETQLASQACFTKVGTNWVFNGVGGRLSIAVQNFDLRADQDMSIRAGMGATLESAVNLLLKGGNTTVTSQGPLALRGSLTTINNGLRPALGIAAMSVNCPADGGSVLVQTGPGSPTLLIP